MYKTKKYTLWSNFRFVFTPVWKEKRSYIRDMITGIILSVIVPVIGSMLSALVVGLLGESLSAVTVIAAILSEEKIKEFYDLAKSLEIDCLVEVHNEKELKKVVACGCDIIGINNRNLKTFDVDLNTTSKLAPLIPYEAVLVSESGMKDENDMKNVKEQGADAVLIGETFMRSDNIKETMEQLRSCL